MAARSSRANERTVALPVAPGPLLGRDRELSDLSARLEHGARLLTLVGPPGTGKTRLALALAHHLARSGPYRLVAFADLTPHRTLPDAALAVAEACSIVLAPGAAPDATVARLGTALAARGQALVVLDNAEHLVEPISAAIGAWRSRAPELAIVVTSRESLRIGGEEIAEIPPLAVPDESADAASILANAAVRLVLARAPSYVASEADAEALGQIARRLEGIPLALELAGARLALMGAAELRDRLARSLDVLGRGRRDAPARHATLRGALDWSWALLDERDRHALACASLFRGSFSAEAAIATIARAPGDAAATLEALQSLRDKSLLSGAEGSRLRMFESVREHARERLDDPEAALRMARWLARAAAHRSAELRGRGGRAALGWLASERENLLAAYDALRERAQDADTVALEVDLLLALDPVLARIGPGGAHLSRLSDVLGSTVLDDGRRARALIARARVLRDRGEMSACVRDLEAARDLLPGAERGAVRAELGEAWLAQGRFDEALSQLELALREAQSWNDRRTEQRARAALGLVHHGRGQLDEAESQYLEALDLAVEIGDAHAEAQARRDLGTLCLMRGQHQRARAHYEEALARSPGDDLRLEGVVRGNLAILDQEQGRLDEALAHLKRALSCLRAVGDRPFEAHLLGYLGAVHHERGQLDHAREAYSRALEVLAEVRDVRLEGIFLAARASALAAKGHTGQAWNDLEIAERRLAEVGDPALVAALGAHRAQVALHEALEGGGGTALEGAIENARTALENARRHEPESDDVRFAMRMLSRAIPAERLEVGAHGAWFRVPGRATVDLSTRQTLARLLDALVQARVERPGAAIAAVELVAAGWPGERMLPLAAQNRLRVALTTLRNLGLRGVIVRRDGGYLLDPDVPAVRA